MKKIGFLCLVFGLSSVILFSQNTGWEKRLGGKGSDAFQRLIQTFDGHLVAAGTTEKADRDIYLVQLSLSGEVLMEKEIDLGQEEFVTCLAQASDQGFWLGGFQEIKNSRQGFLLKLDKNWRATDTIFLGPNSIIHDLAGIDYSDFWATGAIDEQVLLVHFNSTGKLLGQDTYPSPHPQVGKSIQVLPSSHILIAGDQNLFKKQSQLFLLEVDKNGKQIRHRHIPGPQIYTQVNDVLSTPDGLLLIGRTQKHPNGFSDIFTLKVNTEGTLIDQEEFGSIGKEVATRICSGFQDNYFITGHAQSDKNGNTRRSNMWLQEVDANGRFLDGEMASFYGGQQDDAGMDILLAYDGGLVIAGYSASEGAQKRDAWIKYLPLLEKLSPRPASAVLSLPRLLDENGNGSLDFGEAARLELSISNTGSSAIIQLEANLSTSEPGISFPEKIPIGYIGAGEEKAFTIPLAGVKGIVNGKQFLTVQFTASNQIAIASEPIPIRTQEDVRPELQFSGHAFLNPNQQKTGHFFFVNLENMGGLSAKAVKVRFFPSTGVRLLSDQLVTIPKLAAQSSEVIFLEYEAPANGAALSIQCQVICQEDPHLLDSTFTFQPFLAGAAPGNPASTKEQFAWIKPSPQSFNTKFDTVYQNHLSAKAVFISPHPLSNRQVTLAVRAATTAGSKARRRSPAHHLRSVKRGNYFLHFLHGDLHLSAGKNVLSVNINRANLPSYQEEFVLHYDQPRPRLYLLSIGVPYPPGDLKYTTKDAADFAAVMAKQQGYPYDSVHLTLLNTAANTTAPKIKQAIQELVNLQTTNLLRPFDVVMVFISSHGYQEAHSQKGYTFKIQLPQESSSGFNEDIDFEEDILEKLAQINCQRFTFVDACHSGNKTRVEGLASKEVSDTRMVRLLSQLIAAQPDLYSIMSSSGDELSWEDQRWENGAFTKALLEIFNNETQTIGAKPIFADADNDKEITVQEMYAYLKIRVPHLIEQDICTRLQKEQAGPCTVSQTPFMQEQQAQSKLPLILLE